MDLLHLWEVAELLGEPEAVIVAACEEFPAYVPSVGSGPRQRFPSVALDVLRVVTDAMASGAPTSATVHLIQAHFSPETLAPPSDLQPDDPEPAPPVLGADQLPLHPEPEPLDRPSADVGAIVEAAVDRAFALHVHDLAVDMSLIRAELHAVRDLVGVTARSDDLALLRVELRGISTAAASPLPGSDIVAANIASLETALGAQQGALEAIQTELSALRAQIQGRSDLTAVTAEFAGLREALQRPNPDTPHASDHDEALSISANGGGNGGMHWPNPERRSVPRPERHDRPESPPGDADPDAEPQPAVITQFAGRTPRRMGRSLFADEV